MTLVFDHPPRLTWGRISLWWNAIDRVTLVCVLFLMALGLVLGFATSPALAWRNELPPFHYVTRQAMFAVPALGAMFLISMASPRTIRRIGVLMFFAVIGLLILTLASGESRNGSTRWLSFVFFSLQPSELAKPALIAAAAWMFSIQREADAPPGPLMAFLCLAVTAALVALQPDYSQTALLCVVWAVMFFVAGASIIWAVSGLLLALGGGAIAYAVSPYVADRIELLFDLEAQGGYQIRKTLAAIKGGGLWGAGPGEGVEKFGLPDAHTDFVIAVAAEEYGLLLVALVLLAYAMIVLRGLLAATRLRDGFSRIAVAGLCALIGLQAFIHFGVSARMLPPTGMTLPLISYGGSSLLSMSISIGMLLGLTRSDVARRR